MFESGMIETIMKIAGKEIAAIRPKNNWSKFVEDNMPAPSLPGYQDLSKYMTKGYIQEANDNPTLSFEKMRLYALQILEWEKANTK